MAKKVAVLALNPVNGYGLFQYLESFFENKISYKVFAVAEDKNIHTNSGIAIQADDVVANLKGHSDEFDALVFSCGDAFPVFGQHANDSYNVDLISVIKEFGEKNKLMIGHCGSALAFEIAGITAGKKLALHPYIKGAIKNGIATDNAFEVDGNFYTAQCEHTISELMPKILEAIK
jgi:transcriptional regulator GlxA family with amidase domain